MNKQDRNTAVMVAIILLVLIVSLVAVGSGIWRAVGPSVESSLSSLGYFISTTTTSYNFSVPGQSGEVEQPIEQTNTTGEEESTSSVQTEPIWQDYNFRVSQAVADPSPSTNIGLNQKDAILFDVLSEGFDSNHLSDSDLSVQIPKLNMDSEVLTGLDADSGLQEGFIFHPNSNSLNSGEIALVCYRSYLPEEDPRSCLHLNTLESGDEMDLFSGDQEYSYTVVGKAIFTAGDDSIYRLDPNNPNYLRIVAVDPFRKLNKRLVILLERTV